MKILILIALAISMCTATEYVDLKNFTYPLGPETCSRQRDCFNCTLSNCDWQMSDPSQPWNGQCVSTKQEYNITVKQFLVNAPKCQDPGNFCSMTPTPDVMKF